MAMTVEKAQLNNQSILQNFALGEEIDEQAAEIISGGAVEKFRIKNATDVSISYTMDGVETIIKPGQEHRIFTEKGGNIKFDRDTRKSIIIPAGYNLSNGKQYEFRTNSKNSKRINLNLIATL